jgi:protein-S-isoprenylcysteine O-methyltransferase Ste14
LLQGVTKTKNPHQQLHRTPLARRLFVGGGLALGSWLTALVGLLLVPWFIRRTALEDRVLQEQLQGYAAYAQTVRYRLFPGLW